MPVPIEAVMRSETGADATIYFRPVEEGNYRLNVRFDGALAGTSPYTFDAFPAGVHSSKARQGKERNGLS